MKFFQLGIIGVTNSGKTYLTTKIINNLRDKYNKIIIIDDLNQINDENFKVCTCLEDFVRSIVNKAKFHIILRFESGDYTDAFKIIWIIRNCLLIIDELSLFCDVHTIPESLRHIAQRGRLKNISLIWNTQRPANISRNITSQTEFIIAFKLTEINDLRYFWIDKKRFQLLNNLEQGEYIILRGSASLLESRLSMKLHPKKTLDI